MNIEIRPLSTAERESVLPILFSILYENMNPIDPAAESFDGAWEDWQCVISRAMEDDRRTVLIVRENAEIVGFFMYASNGEVFLMEEIQLIPRVQGSGVFREIYDNVLPRLSVTVTAVEAYAHKNNLRSQGILSHLGLSVIGENKNGSCYHYRGDFQDLLKKFNR